MTQLRQYEERFAALNTAVAIVTFDANFMATAYVKDNAISWPLLIDTDRNLYRAYQMERASWWSIYGPSSVANYIKLLFRGRRLRRPGRDTRQLGGDVLVDPQGIVRLHYVSESPHDRPPVADILKIIESALSQPAR